VTVVEDPISGELGNGVEVIPTDQGSGFNANVVGNLVINQDMHVSGPPQKEPRGTFNDSVAAVEQPNGKDYIPAGKKSAPALTTEDSVTPQRPMPDTSLSM